MAGTITLPTGTPCQSTTIHNTTWAYKKHKCRCPEALAKMAAERRRHNAPRTPDGHLVPLSKARDYDQSSVDAALYRIRHNPQAPRPALSSAERRAVIASLKVVDQWSAWRIGRAVGQSTRGVQRHLHGHRTEQRVAARRHTTQEAAA
jgi:hypothetical protein